MIQKDFNLSLWFINIEYRLKSIMIQKDFNF